MISFRSAALSLALGGLMMAGAPALADSVMTSGGRASPGARGPNVMLPPITSNRLANARFRGTGPGNFGKHKFHRDGRDHMRGRGRGDRHDRRRGDFDWVGFDWLPGAETYDSGRTARSSGYFSHGSTNGRGRYDYDRGYPYDHYDGGWDDGAGDYYEGYVREARPRHYRCGAEMRVNVCRG